jgi:hypothetical protein
VNQDSHEERLRSAVDAIVPADGFPSASQAGCLRFWDAMLAGERPEWWRRVGAVLDLLDVAAGGSFPELDQEQQHGVLERLAADPDYVWFASMTNYAFMPSQQHGRCWAGDQVGRHLQGHLYGGSLGIFDDPVNDYVGPGPSIATNDFRHFNAGLVGGAMIANEFVPTPIGAFCYLRDARTAPTAWSGGQGRDATSDLSDAAGRRPRTRNDFGRVACSPGSRSDGQLRHSRGAVERIESSRRSSSAAVPRRAGQGMADRERGHDDGALAATSS